MLFPFFSVCRMTGEKDRQEIVAIKDSIDGKLFQSYCHSLIGGSTVKCSEREAWM
jgi:hypothetical protein